MKTANTSAVTTTLTAIEKPNTPAMTNQTRSAPANDQSQGASRERSRAARSEPRAGLGEPPLVAGTLTVVRGPESLPLMIDLRAVAAARAARARRSGSRLACRLANRATRSEKRETRLRA